MRSHLRITIWLVLGFLLMGSCALTGVLAHSAGTDKAPAGWLLAGSKPENYKTGVDSKMVYEGGPSAYLAGKVQDTGGFGTLMQYFSATQYAGKRVRLRAWVRSEDVSQWAGLWMRVDKGSASVAFDNMESRAIKGSTGWTSYDVVLDVPRDATNVSIGVLLTGPGEVWMNGVKFEAVGLDVPVTGAPPETSGPANLDFQK